ncbi:hypothetical protein C8R44DRAFT_883652 [Mycena epipterygia]|nr:hypothetical protein C8R44DRAFT_883652 [Mycena epipterygia]
MTFLDLPEDVILYTLCRCDVSSVLSISETNRYLHDLAFTATTIWMSLVEDLRHRGFVDRLSAADIRTMSTQSLVALVRRMVVGPETWSRPKIQQPKSSQRMSFSRILHKLASSQEQPATLHPHRAQPACAKIVVHLSLPVELPPAPFYTQVLRGGKYILFSDVRSEGLNPPVLGCWRVADDSLLGTYHTGLASATILDFSAEVFPGGEQANIVIRLRSLASSNLCFVHIVSWDFVTGMTELLSATRWTYSPFHIQTLPNICGNFAVVRTYYTPLWADMCIIIAFRAQKYCKIFCPSHVGTNFSLELVPDYFILTWTPSGKNQKIRVGTITSLSSSWAPMGQHNSAPPILLAHIPHVASHTIKLKGRPRLPIQIAVHEGPLERGTYRMWLRIPHSGTRVLGGAVRGAFLCSFRLSLPGAGHHQLAFRQRSCVSSTSNMPDPGISYSGHTHPWGMVTIHRMLGPEFISRILPPDADPIPIVVEGSGSESQTVTPYSGALASVTQRTLVVCYFE